MMVNGHEPELPPWARWNEAAAAQPWTVGVEEEVMLLHPRSCSFANRVRDVLESLPPELADHVSAETHACVIELHTDPHATVARAVAELAGLRRMLGALLEDELHLRAAVAGTHPLATRGEVSVSPGERYRVVERTMRALARREPTMSLHVHVAVPDGESAVCALDGLRSELPLLLALSANSPYWHGEDSGFASIRTPIFSMFPRVGIPRHFGSYAEYVQAVEVLLLADAIPEPTFLWWDARIQPRLGTVEVRVMDAQSRVGDVAGLAAVVQCLVHRHSQSRSLHGEAPEALAENRFLSARDGMAAQLIDRRLRRKPASDAIADLLESCRPSAGELGCSEALESAFSLAADPGDARQRDLTARHGLAALPGLLRAQFATSPLVAAPA